MACNTLLTASAASRGPAEYASVEPIFTGDGQTIVFQSFATDLITNNFNLGGDLYIVSLSSTNASLNPTNTPPFNITQLVYPSASGSGSSTGSSPMFTWPITPGLNYEVLYKDNLTDPLWQVLNSGVTIVGSQGQATDFAPNSSHRFYQIKAF